MRHPGPVVPDEALEAALAGMRSQPVFRRRDVEAWMLDGGTEPDVVYRAAENLIVRCRYAGTVKPARSGTGWGWKWVGAREPVPGPLSVSPKSGPYRPL